ncbi:hypothetical protein AOLI_G00008400 [Acnodon oligacanthus]
MSHQSRQQLMKAVDQRCSILQRSYFTENKPEPKSSNTMESNQDQQSPPRPTGCWRWYLRPRRNKVIPYEIEEEHIQ